MHACQLCVAHEAFFSQFFPHETILFISGHIPFLLFKLDRIKRQKFGAKVA